MKLYLQYQNHPEGIVADSTAKTFNYKSELEKKETERKEKLKRKDK